MSVELRGKRALVTGAGSGIGRQIAFALAERGTHLWLCDVDRAGVERTALLCGSLGVKVEARRVDVSEVAAMTALADAVHGQGGALDILINNAGVGVAGNLVETDISAWDFAYGVNVKGVVLGCRLFGAAMVEAGRGGHILNVASAAGLLAPRGMSVYAATKFAVVGLSESLRAELRPHRIAVTTLCPGVVDTGIVANTRLEGSLAQKPGFNEKMAAVYKRRGYGPERVAQVAVDALAQRRSGVLPVTPEAWGMYFAKRYAPELVGAITARGGLF